MPVDNLAVDDQWPLINFQLVMEGKEGEIRTNNIDSLHSDSLVHSQKENSKVGFGGNNEFMAPGLFFDFSMGEADENKGVHRRQEIKPLPREPG